MKLFWAIVCFRLLALQMPAQQPPVSADAAPPMPVSRSPVEFFRKLLEAEPVEVERMLADRTPAQKAVIDQKLIEYKLLPPPLREWRLKATELRWYLLPLMKLAPDARGSLLLTVPEEDRTLVATRLHQWDRLGAAEKQEMLASEMALRYVSRPGAAPPLAAEDFNHVTAAERAQIEAAVAQWHSLPKARRHHLTETFREFFTLSAAEKDRTLGLLTASERRHMEDTVRGFDALPPDERQQALEALRKFSRLSPGDRLLFLHGAERWRHLDDRQRQTWRQMVAKLPPLPPGAEVPPVPPGF